MELSEPRKLIWLGFIDGWLGFHQFKKHPLLADALENFSEYFWTVLLRY